MDNEGVEKLLESFEKKGFEVKTIKFKPKTRKFVLIFIWVVIIYWIITFTYYGIRYL